MDQDRFDPPVLASRAGWDLGQLRALAFTLMMIAAAAVVLSRVRLRPESAPVQPPRSSALLVPASEPRGAARPVRNGDGAILEWPGSDREPRKRLGPKVPEREPKSTGRQMREADGSIREVRNSWDDPRRTLGPKDPPKDAQEPGHGRPYWDGGAR